VARAAKVRVFRWENVAAGGLHARRRAHALRSAFVSVDCPVRKRFLQDWLDRSFVVKVADGQALAYQTAQAQGVDFPGLFLDSEGNPIDKRLWQRTAFRFFSENRAVVQHNHLRRKLDLWPLDLLPGRRVARALSVLRAIGSLCPPKVWAAYFRCLLRGWMCARSFGGKAPCRLGCGVGQDELQHLPHCRVTQALFLRYFNVDLRELSGRVDKFLLLHGAFDSPAAGARALYCLYRAHNSARLGGAEAAHVFGQVAREFPAVAVVAPPSSTPSPSSCMPRTPR